MGCYRCINQMPRAAATLDGYVYVESRLERFQIDLCETCAENVRATINLDRDQAVLRIQREREARRWHVETVGGVAYMVGPKGETCATSTETIAQAVVTALNTDQGREAYEQARSEARST